MLVSQGKVLSPGKEVYGCDCVCLPLSPILLDWCSYANFRAFPLFYWCNSMYMLNARVSVCTVRRPAC